jgi:hypothetical protein
MSNREDTRIVLGSLRYKTASNTDLGLKVPFIQTTKENVEFDRSLDINLGQLFDDERQTSTNFRPSCKFSILFKNSYTGFSNYDLLENQLYYTDEYNNADQNCPPNSNVRWGGFPQYNEFDFIRNDYNVSGYTVPDISGYTHVNFVSKSASTYNWNYFMTYAFDNDYNKPMSAIDSISQQTLNWVSSDGIPFVVVPTTIGGVNLISFRCPVKHNLKVGEAVKLSLSYNGFDTFQVTSLGTGIPGTKFYTFNIDDIGFTGSTFNINSSGTFKRVINPDIPNETTSKYYVRRHKILTDINDAALVNAGFEQNIYGQKRKYESSGLTPNHIARVSVKEGGQSYTLSFNSDLDIERMIDNQKRPVSELFFTVIYKGYFGLMFGQLTDSGTNVGLKQGYDFNLPLDESVTPNRPSPWWNINNTDSDTNFPLGIYYRLVGSNQRPFYYVKTLNKGDVIDGDYCEWNDSEQKERVISEINHKLIYNPLVFSVISQSNGQTDLDALPNPFGYYYKPHNKLKIRGFSDYIETGSAKNVIGIPNYSYFSTSQNLFIWRDLYTYGFIDKNGDGVNYPFFNYTHYPYDNYEFRIIPEGTNYIESDLSHNASIYGTGQPKIDNCE